MFALGGIRMLGQGALAAIAAASAVLICAAALFLTFVCAAPLKKLRV